MSIKDIKVLETMKEGKSLYTAPAHDRHARRPHDCDADVPLLYGGITAVD
jgi:hypothetical protein